MGSDIGNPTKFQLDGYQVVSNKEGEQRAICADYATAEMILIHVVGDETHHIERCGYDYEWYERYDD